MPYIKIVFQGHRTFGGYLMIDGNKYAERKLQNGQIIQVASGFHQLRLTSMSQTEIERSNMRIDNPRTSFDVSAREYGKLVGMMDCSINHEFDSNDLMTINIMSGINGEILETPTYLVNNLYNEERENADREYNSYTAAVHAAERKEASKPINVVKDTISTTFIWAKRIILWGLFLFLAACAVSCFITGEGVGAKIFWSIAALVSFSFAFSSMDD